VGDRICELAVRERGGATWVGVSQSRGSRHWALSVAGLDVYDGVAGIALALAYLGDVTGEERYARMARAAYGTMRAQLARALDAGANPADGEDEAGPPPPIGFFSGWGGVIATLAHLTALWGDADPLHQAQGIVEILPSLIERDRSFDVVQGSAGCIAGLLCLARIAPSDRVTAALRHCGDRLAAGAEAMPAGIGWTVFPRTPPLTGFAHGSAGFAWALLRLWEYVGDERYHRLAADALAYERAHFDPGRGNWRDPGRARTGDRGGDDAYLASWCYGAPGIGLARLDTLPLLDDETVRDEIHAALATTLAVGLGGSHCLCHGDLGNLEFVQRAADRQPALLPEAALAHLRVDREVVTTSLLELARQDGWCCGTPRHVETPGLMAGLAGIALQLLRLADPSRVPSPLTMDPPPAAAVAAHEDGSRLVGEGSWRAHGRCQASWEEWNHESE